MLEFASCCDEESLLDGLAATVKTDGAKTKGVIMEFGGATAGLVRYRDDWGPQGCCR
jgi:hypothetical protein